MKYPEHIYDPIRYEVASALISHELKKIFPDYSLEEYKRLQDQIYEWPNNPKKYSLTKEPRDFWNGVEGIMTGFRIKGIVRFITAQNVKWNKERAGLDKFIFTTDHFFVNDIKIPTLNKTSAEVIEWLSQNNLTSAALRKAEESYNKGIPRVDDPIYGKKDDKGNYYVHDGNGRVLYFLLKGHKEVDMYAGELIDEKPYNYWVYTMFLINISKLYQHEVITKEIYKNIMLSIFKESEPAIVEYAERVPDNDTLKAFILEPYL